MHSFTTPELAREHTMMLRADARRDHLVRLGRASRRRRAHRIAPPPPTRGPEFSPPR